MDLSEHLQEFTSEQLVWLVKNLTAEHGEESVRRLIEQLEAEEEATEYVLEQRAEFLQQVEEVLARVQGMQATFEANGGRAHLFAHGGALSAGLQQLLDTVVRPLAGRKRLRLALLLLCDLAQTLCEHTDDSCKNYGEAETFLAVIERLACEWLDDALACTHHTGAIDDRWLLSAAIAAFDDTPWKTHQEYGWPNTDEWMAATRAHARLRALGVASSLHATSSARALGGSAAVDSDIDLDSESDEERAQDRAGPAVTVLPTTSSTNSAGATDPSPSTRLRITHIHSLMKQASSSKPTSRARRLVSTSSNEDEPTELNEDEPTGSNEATQSSTAESELITAEDELDVLPEVALAKRKPPDQATPEETSLLTESDSVHQHFATAAPGSNTRAARRRVVMVVDSDSEEDEDEDEISNR